MLRLISYFSTRWWLIFVIFLVGSLFLTGCAILKTPPQINSTRIYKVELVDKVIHADFMMDITNPSINDIKVTLTSMHLYIANKPITYPLPHPLHYVLRPGNNAILIPVIMNQDTLIYYTLDMLIKDHINVDVKGSLIYEYINSRGKYYFDYPFSLNMEQVVKVMLNKLHL